MRAQDEVISAGGYREDVTLAQIRVNLDMESHEEKLAQMIKASKMAQAKVRRLRPPAARPLSLPLAVARAARAATRPSRAPRSSLSSSTRHCAGGGQEAG